MKKSVTSCLQAACPAEPHVDQKVATVAVEGLAEIFALSFAQSKTTAWTHVLGLAWASIQEAEHIMTDCRSRTLGSQID